MADVDLRTYLHILRRRWMWTALATIVVLLGVIGIDHVRTKEYTAVAQLLVQPASTVSNAVTQQTLTSTQVLTEMQLLTSAPVKSLVQHVLHYSSLQAVPVASTAQIGQTNVISVSARSSSATEAALIVNTYAREFVSYERSSAISSQTAAESQVQEQISALERQIATLQTGPTSVGGSSGVTSTTSVSPQVTALLSQEEVLKEELAQLQVNGAVATGEIQLVSPALPPISPSSPRPVRDAIIAAFAGLALGVLLALLVEHLDDAVYSKDDAEEASGVPVLAVVPKLSTWKSRTDAYLVAVQRPTSTATEAYRSLRTALQFAGHDTGLRTILVTSPSASEGKTSTVANLGVVLAGADQRVVLVSCDLRKPRLCQFLGVAEEPGFTSILLGEVSTADAVRPVPDVENMFVLPAGPIPPNPAELLAGSRGARVFDELREMFDTVIIDSPPIVPVTDAQILSEFADATVLVVASGETAKGELQRAAELLEQVHAKSVGVVLNEVTRRMGSGYSPRYGYGYGYGYGARYAPTPVLASSNGSAAEQTVGSRDS